VNIFVTEALRNRVSGAFGTFFSRSAKPKASRTSTRPPSTNRIAPENLSAAARRATSPRQSRAAVATSVRTGSHAAGGAPSGSWNNFIRCGGAASISNSKRMTSSASLARTQPRIASGVASVTSITSSPPQTLNIPSARTIEPSAPKASGECSRA
jgi:hypothetical protein